MRVYLFRNDVKGKSRPNPSIAMFTTKQLTTPAELARFSADYKLASLGVTVSADYLQRVRQVTVVVLTARPDVYLGGYVINDVPPHRYFIAPGEAAKDRSLASLHLCENDLVEIGAIWFKKYRSPFREIHRLVFFAAMLRDALKTGRPFILGGSFVQKIQQAQRNVLPMLIYEDRVTVGEVTATLQLYVGSRRGIWLRFARTLVKDVTDRLLKQRTPTTVTHF
ncbi:hypothetical protein [Fibrella forsythiae]|uniref:Uncharacterized protein n=1 Tax=Fibrella forsythiae TaxID=2817061 RepID=A0ABS3JHZ5_9BACT|nr:hypothetical protein [Fibrella forsythiae]MBO0949630.1 hypothetical protein [Fibrella forsythiae]